LDNTGYIERQEVCWWLKIFLVYTC